MLLTSTLPIFRHCSFLASALDGVILQLLLKQLSVHHYPLCVMAAIGKNQKMNFNRSQNSHNKFIMHTKFSNWIFKRKLWIFSFKINLRSESVTHKRTDKEISHYSIDYECQLNQGKRPKLREHRHACTVAPVR